MSINVKVGESGQKKKKNLLFHLLIGREHDTSNSIDNNGLIKSSNIKKINSEHVKKFYFNK